MKKLSALLLSLCCFSTAQAEDGGTQLEKPADDQASAAAGQGDTGDAGKELGALRGQAATWYLQGQALEAQHALLEARERFRKVLLVQPQHPGARAAVARLDAALGEKPAGTAASRDRRSASEQLADIEVVVALTRAERLAIEGKYEEAREAAQMAAAQLQATRRPDLRDRLGTLNQRIAELQQATQAHQDDADFTQRLLDQQTAWRQQHQRQKRTRSKYDDRIAAIVDKKQRKHYELALALARGVVTDYPSWQPGEALFAKLLDLVHLQRFRDHEDKMLELKKEIFERIHRSMIPTGIDGAPEYPASWFDVQEKRESVWLQDERVAEEWKDDFNNKLAERRDIDLPEINATEALDQLSRLTGLNIVVDSEVRAAAEVPITLQAKQMQTRSILDWICRQAGVRWRLRNEAIWVGGDKPDPGKIKIYNINSLIHVAPDFAGLTPAAFNLGGDGGGGGAGGFDLFGGGGADGEGETLAPEDLVDLIEKTVAPESWDNPDYSIRVRNNELFVRTSQDIHDLVEEFLHSQLRTNQMHVFLRMSWLEITDDFMEEIGVDWHNLGNQVVLSPASINGYTDRRQEWSLTSNLVNRLPERATDLGRGLLTAGLQLNWINLGDKFVNMIFRAQEQKRKVRELNSIELATLNGVRGNTFFGRQVAYISGYDVAGNGNFDPVIDVLNIGQSLDIKPFVSADRKYVTLDLQPILVSASLFTENLSTGVNVNGLVGIVNYPLELPNLEIKAAGTRVIIPDNGTTLVGGFGESIDQHAETMIPIIGHIPFLGRLFGMRGRYQEKYKLYLRISARIVLYEEEETYL